MNYMVSAEMETVTRPTTVQSAAGNSHADPGQVVVTLSDGTQVVFASAEAVASVFSEVPEPKMSKKK